MPEFRYQARSRFDLEQRIHQTKDGGSVPKADGETRCETCKHIKEFHCRKWRVCDTPRYLWVWNYAQPRLRYPVRCKHSPVDVTLLDGPPKCTSTSCTVADCPCNSFASPYRKPRAPKKATAKPATRKKRATKQLDLSLVPGG